MKATTYSIIRFIVWINCFALALSANVYAVNQATFYVSPAGNDADEGTEAAPFKTIARAQKAVRAINSSMTGDIVVYLREGTYQLSNTMCFNNEDGGSNGHYVRYENYPNERPLITGGIPVSEWTLYDEGKDIWCVKNVEARFRQLYVNNKKAIRARYPNLGDNGEHNFFRLAKVDTFGKALNINTDYVSDWKNPKKVEMHLMIAWAEAILRLDKTTNYGGYTKFEPQEPERTMLFNRPYPMLGTAFMSNPPKQQCFYLENAYEFIDAPGEWYLDESDNTLYYKPRSGENMRTASVVAPRLETLFEIKGNSTADKLGYFAINGLAFAHTNFLRPSHQGFLDLQAGMYNVAAPGGNVYYLWRPPAGVTVENAHHVRIEKNIFSQMAATGLDFMSGTNDDMIQANVFNELGGAGIMIGKFSQDTLTEIHVAYNPMDKEEISTRDTIKNNLITNVTNESQGAVGIGAGYPRNILIEHNEVSYMNYSGISVGFGWTKQENAMTNNRINWNEIHHVAQLLTDCGAVYTLSNQGSNSEIQYNYMHDIQQSKWADYWILPIYLDEGSSGFDVSHNVSINAPGGVASNQAGYFTQSDNDGRSQTVIDYAGIEKDYKWIKNETNIPLANFSAMVPQAPYKTMMEFPGTIEAEDYDEGGQSVSYHDIDYTNEGGFYREDGVDIVKTDSISDEYAIGYTQTGEWLEYTVDVKKAGSYTIEAIVSSGLENSSFRLFLDGEAVTDTILVPQGEDWDTYVSVKEETANLSSGIHVLRLLITGSYVNVDKMIFKDQETIELENVTSNEGIPCGSFRIFNLLGIQKGIVNIAEGDNLKDNMDAILDGQGLYILKSLQGDKSYIINF